MAGKAEKTNNKTIIGVVCAAVVLIVIVILLILFLKPGGVGFGGGLNDDYFVSDGTKLVLSLDKEDISTDEEEYAPNKLHQVYYYSGEKITGMSYFYEYADVAAAKAAYDHIKSESESEAKEIKLNGKYIEIVMDEGQFADTTTDEVKENIEFMKMLNDMNYEDGMSDDVVEFDDEEEYDEEYVEEYDEEYEEEDF